MTNNMMRVISIKIIVLALFAISSSDAYAKDIQFVTIGTAAPGGTFYVLGIGMADVINKNLENFEATANTTGGTLESLRLLGKGSIQLALANIRSHSAAYLGNKPFKNPYENIRKGFYLHTSIFHVVTNKKTNIKTIHDLKGQTVSLGTSGSIVETIGKYLFTLHGLDMADIKIRHIPPGESVDALSDGTIDAFCLFSAIPSSAVNALGSQEDVVIVACDEDKLIEAQNTQRFLKYEVPANTYKGQDTSVPVLAVVATADFNENDDIDYVYKIAKTVIENREYLKKVHPLGGRVRLLTKAEADTSAVPFHPGILKYAKEVGVEY